MVHMNLGPETAAIINPTSAGGRSAALWRQIAAGLGPVKARFTEAPGHASSLARELLDRGYERIIAVGGDGTANEVLNGFLHEDRPVSETASLAVIPMGIGRDFGRSLGIRSVEEAVRVLAAGSALPMDAGKVTFRDHSGMTRSRYFANVASFGMGGEVAARSRNLFRHLGGKAAFLYATLRVFLSYRAKAVELGFDGDGAAVRHSIMNVAVGNGRFHGGGMHICPLADMSDGLLDISVVDALGLWILARDLKVLYSPNLYIHPKTRHYRARTVTARSDQHVSLEVDGEALGVLPAELSLLPRAIRVWRAAGG